MIETTPEKVLLPLFPVTESLCGSCTALCCSKGTIIELSLDEATYLTDNGAELAETDLPPVYDETGETIETYTFYLMKRDCPFLVQAAGGTALCSIYEDPKRPAVCGEFQAASQPCYNMRQVKGI